jgi:hypothetical protein
MINPERILYYIENVCLMTDGGSTISPEEKETFFKELYMWCHVGTAQMHSCEHPNWEEEFFEAERKMIASGFMRSYDVVKMERKKGEDEKSHEFLQELNPDGQVSKIHK